MGNGQNTQNCIRTEKHSTTLIDQKSNENLQDTNEK